MTRHLFRSLSAALLLLTTPLLFAPLSWVRACATVPRDPAHPAAIASEEAVIVWDISSKTEHFIRRATFNTRDADFGFLVPTPSKPLLSDVSGGAFDALTRITGPETIYRYAGVGCAPLTASAVPEKAAAAVRPGVRVLDTQRVAGMDAAVLEADRADALNDWLKIHGYPSSPALADWLKPYVAAKWMVTAFKIARSGGARGPIATSALRMSFTTQTPIYPYREPAGVGQTYGRLLRVYCISGGRMEGALGEKSDEWPGATVWAGTLPDADTENLRGLLSMAGVLTNVHWYLTTFEDNSTVRPGDADIYFQPAKTQDSVRRPPVIVIRPASDLALPFLLLVAAIIGMVTLAKRLQSQAVDRSG